MGNPVPPDPKANRLNGNERWGAIGLAALVAFLAILAYLNPQEIRSASPSDACVPTTDVPCSIVTDTPTDKLVIALALVAGVLALVAVLGIRFNKVKAGDVELGVGEVAETKPDEAAERTKGEVKGEDKVRAAVAPATPATEGAAWDRLPDWAQEALMRWAMAGDVVSAPLRTVVVESAKEGGQGNRPWFVTVRLDDGNLRTLKVTTGRGSATVG